MEFFPHYTRAAINIFQDYDTHHIEVQAHIGTAPDSNTIIVYPYRKYESGYWNKGQARKVAAKLKRDLKEFVKANSIELSEPIAEYERFC